MTLAFNPMVKTSLPGTVAGPSTAALIVGKGFSFFSGLLSSLWLSYGESNKPQCGCRGQPLHNALAPPTRHWVFDRRLLSHTRGNQRDTEAPELWI